jgi:hypothetical protein
VRFTVIAVGALFVERHGEGFVFLTHLVIHGDLFYIHASRNGILVEDDVVGATLVVEPGRKEES